MSVELIVALVGAAATIVVALITTSRSKAKSDGVEGGDPDALREAPKELSPAPPPRQSHEAVRVLFLASEPLEITRLSLGREVRALAQGLRDARRENTMELEQEWAVQASELATYITHHRPHILHFACSGTSDGGLLLEDATGRVKRIRAELLAQIVSQFSDVVRCVVFTACHSQIPAKLIAEKIEYAIGMGVIADEDAVQFTAGFYQAVACGRDVETAFNLGCTRMDVDSEGEGRAPQLFAFRRPPSQMRFLPGIEDVTENQRSSG